MGPKNPDRLKKNVGWVLGPIWVPKIARRRRAEKNRSPFWDPDAEILKYHTFGTHLGPKKRAPKARENFWSPFLGPI